jgi:uncharacterized protein (TIGR00299 family) protein
MKILYLDTSWGISGDMTIAAMLDLGLPFDLLKENIGKLGISGYDLKQLEILRCGLRAKRFIVEIEEHDPHHGSEHHRDLKEILQIIDSSSLSEKIKVKSGEMFRLLAEAEAHVHGKKIEEVHFHEVGALDSIIDIVGACIAFDYFSPSKVICGKINLGSGFVNTAHGRLAVPPPAVAELSKGLPIFSDGTDMELTTPTGALILRSFVTDFQPMPAMKLLKTGCGAGTKELQGKANMLRIFLGESEETVDNNIEKITVLETEIDDMPAENFGHLMDQLIALPVLDVFFTPVQMKKNRPGTLITVLTEPESAKHTAEIILKNTTTFGVRYYEALRLKLDRKIEEVETDYGMIRIKTGAFGHDNKKISPEFEDCSKAAMKHGVPLNDVQTEAVKKYNEREKK